MKDALLWFLRFGVENWQWYPPTREQKHLEYKGPTNAAIEQEWQAIQAYYREIADVDRDAAFRVKRAGEKYLATVKRIRKPLEAKPQFGKMSEGG